MNKGIYSITGIVGLLLALLTLNYVASVGKQRVDLTANQAFTLSDGTKKVLRELKDPVRLRLYYTQAEDSVPLPTRDFARRVEDLLDEYRQASGGKIIIEKLNPQPDSDAEDSAALDGIDAQMTQTGERFYLGIAAVQDDRKSAIGALAPDRERLLEYDLTRAITRTATKDKPVLAVMTPLFVTGNPMAMMQGQPSQPQYFWSELERDYKIERIGLDVDAIRPEIKTLVVMHPRGISDRAQYALDQFVLRGGRLLVFVDPMAYFDQIPGMPAGGNGTSSTLIPLFKAWGIEMSDTKVVLDIENAAGQGQRQMPTVLALDGPYLNRDDIATSQISNALIPMAGAFTGKPAEGLTETVLIKSSKNAQLVDLGAAEKRGREAIRGFASEKTEFPIAIKLSGLFKTAFPEGKPYVEPTAEEIKASVKGDESKADAKADDGKKTDAAADEGKKTESAPKPKFVADSKQLKVSAAPNTVVLVADADFMNDGAAVQIQELFGRRIAYPVNGNLPLFQALIEQMAGDPALIGLASRQVATRPLTMVRQIEADAQQRYLGKLKELEDSLNEARDKVNSLAGKSAGAVPGAQPGAAGAAAAAKPALSPEQQAEVEKFRKKMIDTRAELKDVRKELRADTEALEFWTKVLNIFGMPVLVALAGIYLALRRRNQARPAA